MKFSLIGRHQDVVSLLAQPDGQARRKDVGAANAGPEELAPKENAHVAGTL